MNLLLDTHTLLWWLADNPTLSEEAREAITKPGNTIFVNIASVWELAIKKALGKLEVPENLQEALDANRFQILSITLDHALAVADLPLHHKDPFDRMLIVQAQLEDLTLVTRDNHFRFYSISCLEA